MEKFIYVFGDAARDKLMAAGYTLMKGDPKKGLYVFLNKPSHFFENKEGLSILYSNHLTF